MSSAQPSPDRTYDVAILGSGLGGSMLGAVLARHGARVLLLDAESHPRFAHGEVPTPRSMVALRVVAERYGVPELKTLTSFENLTRILGPQFGIQRHWGFLRHREGERQDPREVTQSVTPALMHTAAHLYRQETDSHVYHTAVRYGCTPRQGFRVTELELAGDGVTVAGQDGSEYRARYLVDASGRKSPVADKLGLRDGPSPLKHRSRMAASHLIGVRPTDGVLAARSPRDVPPVPWHQGSVHHLFDGGWIWVTPFDNTPRSRNPLCSVGLMLDPQRHPDAAGSGADEVGTVAARFPDIGRQLDGAAAFREWEVVAAVPYASSQLVGDRWCLLGESAGFVDPLFSRSLSDTTEAVNALAWRLLRAIADDDFSADRFDYLQRLQRGFLSFDDDLVRSAYAAFDDYDLWNAVFRIWAWGSGGGSFRLQSALTKFLADGREEHFTALEDVPHVGFCWPDHDGFKALFDGLVARAEAHRAGTLTGREAARDLFAMLEEADFVPKHLGFAERDERFLNPTPKKIIRSLRWARTGADPQVRRLLMGNVQHAVGSRLRGRRIF
jgi:tetracycline 7-halogenase / FADH2 O2-dependent halogenase